MKSPSNRLIRTAVVAVTVLHKLVSQQDGPLVMLPRLCREGRLARPAIVVHRFVDAQPKSGTAVDPLVTVEKSLFTAQIICFVNNNL